MPRPVILILFISSPILYNWFDNSDISPMPKNNNKLSDDDVEYKRNKHDYNYEEDIKGKDFNLQQGPRRRRKVIFTNAVNLLAGSFTTPTLPSTTIAKSHMAGSSQKTHFIMASCSRDLPKIEEDPESRRTRPRMKDKSKPWNGKISSLSSWVLIHPYRNLKDQKNGRADCTCRESDWKIRRCCVDCWRVAG